VRWTACVQRLAAEGATTFVEVGPGRVLTALDQAHRRGGARLRRGGSRRSRESRGGGRVSHLTGKVAVVTGGTRGIGLAIAAWMIEHGASVVISGRDADRRNVAVKELARDGGPGGWDWWRTRPGARTPTGWWRRRASASGTSTCS